MPAAPVMLTSIVRFYSELPNVVIEYITDYKGSVLCITKV